VRLADDLLGPVLARVLAATFLEITVRFFGAAFFSVIVLGGVTTPVRTANLPSAVPIASAAAFKNGLSLDNTFFWAIVDSLSINKLRSRQSTRGADLVGSDIR
jgi:hypothetical protein